MRAPWGKELPSLPWGWFVLGLVACLMYFRTDRGPDDVAPKSPERKEIAAGRALFLHMWSPQGRDGLGGDGLGPAYNDMSCVSCHNMGGAGGAGPTAKNVDLLSMSRGPRKAGFQVVPTRRRRAVVMPGCSFSPVGSGLFMADGTGSLVGRTNGHGSTRPAPDPFVSIAPVVARFLQELGRIGEDGFALAELLELHPGFREASTVTLHRFGTDPAYAAWRNARFSELMTGRMDGAMIGMGAMPSEGFVQTRSFPEAQTRTIQEVKAPTSTKTIGPFVVTRSQRNPTSLFGLGLIDAIPEAAIVAEAERQASKTPATAGRVGRVSGGRVGRLGWKGQTASVEDFVLDACAVEVGLEVPGHAQGALPPASRAKASGLDLTAEECASLVAFVRSLPRPIDRPASGEHASIIAEGRGTFAAIGCADCHTPDLGGVQGLYSDLLLHDMGSLMAVSGSYNSPGGIIEDPSSDEGSSSPLLAAEDLGPVIRGSPERSTPGATRREWRTPPLWGVCDSRPYLHDGRAQSFDEAVSFHGGQGEAAARRYFELTPESRIRLYEFLNSLISPGIERPSLRANPAVAG